MPSTRVTTFTYDWRGRRTAVDGEEDFYEKTFYDNLDRVTKVDRHDTSAEGNLIARSETKYDDRGRVFQTIRHAVNPATGAVGNSLTDNTWYDAAGNVIKRQTAGSKQFTKTVFDGLGRQTREYQGFQPDAAQRRAGPQRHGPGHQHDVQLRRGSGHADGPPWDRHVPPVRFRRSAGYADPQLRVRE